MRFLFCGASGYGNVGDDGYRLVFAEALGGEHELLFDSPYPDILAVDWADVVVIGGGGLIYCNESSHFDYMSMYLDRALELRKAIAFVSCGVQLRPSAEHASWIDQGREILAPWHEYLSRARVVTLRSRTCVDIVRAVAPAAKVHYFPDACYLLRPTGFRIALPGAHIVIPTPSGRKNREFKLRWKRLKKLHAAGDAVHVASFSRDDLDTVRQLAQDLTRHENLVTRLHNSPIDAINLVAGAASVTTNRYHGAVLARAAGVAEESILLVDGRYKSRVEEPPEDLELARGHMRELLASL